MAFVEQRSRRRPSFRVEPSATPNNGRNTELVELRRFSNAWMLVCDCPILRAEPQGRHDYRRAIATIRGDRRRARLDPMARQVAADCGRLCDLSARGYFFVAQDMERRWAVRRKLKLRI